MTMPDNFPKIGCIEITIRDSSPRSSPAGPPLALSISGSLKRKNVPIAKKQKATNSHA